MLPRIRKSLYALSFSLLLTTSVESEVLTPPLQADTGSARLGGAEANKAGPVKLADPSADRSQSCDSACLTGFAERYLLALTRRDFAGLPVSPRLMVAENAHLTRIGAGLWKVLEKVSERRAILADPVAGQVVVITTLEESAHQPFIFLLRLKIEDRLIAEVESMVTADVNAAQHFRPDNLLDFDSVVMAPLAMGKRLTRPQLLAAMDTMFYGSGTPLTVADSCIHWENGDRLALFKCSASRVARPGGLSTTRALRHVVIDEVRGVVVSYMLQDAVPYLNPNPPDYERTPLFYQRPLTLYLVQVAKIEAGNVLSAHHVFMNAQEAGVPATFVE
jgi:hypothetical protein